MERKWKIDEYKPELVKLENNSKIVETAGFVPLEVKFKQFEQNGLRAQFSTSEFTSNDYRDMYLSPNTEILPTDDLEEIEEKLYLQEMKRREILEKKNSKLGDSNEERSDEAESPSLEDSKKDKVKQNEVKTGEESV